MLCLMLPVFPSQTSDMQNVAMSFIPRRLEIFSKLLKNLKASFYSPKAYQILSKLLKNLIWFLHKMSSLTCAMSHGVII